MAYAIITVRPGEIAGWIAEETGYAYDTVAPYLDEEYKREYKRKSVETTEAEPSLEDSIVTPYPDLDSQLNVEAEVKHQTNNGTIIEALGLLD